MTITIDIHNWKHIPQELATTFVLGKLQEQINNGEFAQKMNGNYYNENGIEYSVKVKG
jgi:hypothetical protein